MRRDMDGASRWPTRLWRLPAAPGVRDAESQAQVFKGYAVLARGDWKEGLALIDEATSVALSGDAGLRSASDVYCVTISACRDLAISAVPGNGPKGQTDG